jgi:hypothetical protein
MAKDINVKLGWLKGIYIYTNVNVGAGGFGLGIITTPDVIRSLFSFQVKIKLFPSVLQVAFTVHSLFCPSWSCAFLRNLHLIYCFS